VEEVSFFNVVCWADLAENVSASVQKGSRIIVNGRLRQRSWETDNNEKRSVVEVIAEEVGPSLRWATAQISRTERKGPGDGPGPGPRRDAEVPAPAGGGAAGGYDDFGEEPF
jgi:single-strand DNA-binding protein